MKKTMILIASVFVVIAMFIPTLALNAEIVSVSYAGKPIYEKERLLVDGVTYVPFRDFYSTTVGAQIKWNAKSSQAAASTTGLTVNAKAGEAYIEANGRYLYTGNKNIIHQGTMYIPLRPAAKAIGAHVTWNQASFEAIVTKAGSFIENGSSYYNQDDLYWLSRIISAEAKGESLKGKIAVGNVIQNRVKNKQYPNTIKEVIFDRRFGVQFSPTANGSIYDTPTEESIIAAKICLEGYSMNASVLFFLNVDAATNLWIVENCSYVMKIGNHSFYA